METNRFYLKEMTNSDIANIHKGLSNPDVTKYYDVHFDTLEETAAQMKWYADLKANGTGLWWTITSKDNGEFYGAAGFNALEKEHRKAEIGLWLLPEYWGQGILPEVMPLVCKAGFDLLDLNRIEGYVVHENVKCKRAMEKMNFRLEGTMLEYEKYDNNWIDVDIYATLRREWEGYS